MGIHTAVGGNCDYPTRARCCLPPSLAALDTTTRIIANRLGIKLTELKVTVDAHVDVRGTLRVNPQVPVGFQSIDIKVDIKAVPGVAEEQLAMLLKAAEHSCVVLLRHCANPPRSASRQQQQQTKRSIHSEEPP